MSGFCPHCRGIPGALEAMKQIEFHNPEKILLRQRAADQKKQIFNRVKKKQKKPVISPAVVFGSFREPYYCINIF